MRQLLGRRQRHEFAAILKPTALNDPVKQLGLKSRDDLRELWRVQNTIEQITLVSTTFISAAAKVSAIPRPIPLAAPVTTATLSLNSFI
jgi:hypothetical protein